MTPEARVKKAINTLVRQHGGFVATNVATGFGRSGQLDMTACVNGRYLGIEAKATAKSKVTALQHEQLDQIRKAGGCAMIVHADNLQDLEDMLQILNQKPW